MPCGRYLTRIARAEIKSLFAALSYNLRGHMHESNSFRCAYSPFSANSLNSSGTERVASSATVP